jgi:hypothetical protein
MNVQNPRVQFIARRTIRLVDWWSVETALGTLMVRVGAESDGASIPSVLWGLPGMAAFAGDTLPAAFAHDQLYAAELVDRAAADEIFRDLLRRCGVGSVRAWLMYRSVRTFGGAVWRRHTPASIQKARRYAAFFPWAANPNGA